MGRTPSRLHAGHIIAFPLSAVNGRRYNVTTHDQEPPMKVHEYQAKELLAAAGANVPKHIVCKTPDEVAAAFDQLSNGGGVVVKAQVHAGGRGAGQLMDYADKLGGVKFVTSKEKAKAVAEAMLRHALKTKQTGPEGT